MLVDAGEDPTKAAIWKGSRAKKGLDTLDEAPEFLLRSYSFGIRHFFPFWLDPQMWANLDLQWSSWMLVLRMSQDEPSINPRHLFGSSGPIGEMMDSCSIGSKHGANKLISIIPKKWTRDINDIFLPSRKHPWNFQDLVRCVVQACATGRNHNHCERDPRRRSWRLTVSVARYLNTWLTDTQKTNIDTVNDDKWYGRSMNGSYTCV